MATREAGELLEFMDSAAGPGAVFVAQTHCRGISVLLSFKSRLPFDLIPAWHGFRAQPERGPAGRAGGSRHEGPPASSRRGTSTTGRSGRSAPRPAHLTSKESRCTGRACHPTRRWPTSLAERRCPPGRSHDRPGHGDQPGAALHPAQPLPPGRGDPAAGLAPSPIGHDVLGFRRPSQPDRRRVHPHPPARLLGPRPRRSSRWRRRSA